MIKCIKKIDLFETYILYFKNTMRTRSNKTYDKPIEIPSTYVDKWLDYRPVYMTREKKALIKKHLEKSMNMMNKCYCCIRHTKNRVTFNDFENGATGDFPDKNTPLYLKMFCKCSCRQTTRFICRRLCELCE